MAASFSAWINCSSRRFRSVTSRPEMETQVAPVAFLVAHARFHRGKCFAAGKDFVVHGTQGASIFRMGARAELRLADFFRLKAQYFHDTWTDEGVTGGVIQHKDQVRKTVDQTACKFLLLMEAALHDPAGSDIHERALITDHCASAITHCGRSVQADERCAVFAR